MQQQKRLPAPPASEMRRAPRPPVSPPRNGSSANVAVALGITWGFVVLGVLFEALSGVDVRFNLLIALAGAFAIAGVLFELKKR